MAIKNEVASHTLYTSAAEAVSESGVKKVLLDFAKEESKHKMRLEKIYDEDVLQEF